MEKEEELMAEKNEEDEQKFKEENESDEKITSEKKYKMLMHLLGKSQFYTDYLLSKIDSQKEEERKKNLKNKKKANNKVNDENFDSSNTESSSSSQENVTSNKRKANKASNNVGKKRKKNYAISEVISKQMIEEAPKIEEVSENNIEPPKYFENGTLRQYQLEGFSWLKIMYENGVNAILADEMGLGKTVQCIALICYLVEMEIPGPFLVIGPLSTLPNWFSEFQRFAPQIPVLIYHGTKDYREEKRNEILKGVKVEGIERKILPVVITSYEVSFLILLYIFI